MIDNQDGCLAMFDIAMMCLLDSKEGIGFFQRVRKHSIFHHSYDQVQYIVLTYSLEVTWLLIDPNNCKLQDHEYAAEIFLLFHLT